METLRTFTAVVQEGSFTRAANRLHLSQSAVSARIGLLERHLGCALFMRVGRKIRLTTEGELFAAHVAEVLERFDTGVDAVRRLGGAETPRLVVGSTQVGSVYFLPRIMEQFYRMQPQAQVVVRTGSSARVIAMLTEGVVDVGLVSILHMLQHAHLHVSHLQTVPFLLVAGPDHPAASRTRITVTELLKWRLIAYDRQLSNQGSLQELFQRLGAWPQSLLHVDNQLTAREMARRGLGLAFLPEPVVSEALQLGQLAQVHIDSFTVDPMPTNLVYRESRRANDLIARFHLAAQRALTLANPSP